MIAVPVLRCQYSRRTGEVSILRQSRRFYDCWPLKGA